MVVGGRGQSLLELLLYVLALALKPEPSDKKDQQQKLNIIRYVVHTGALSSIAHLLHLSCGSLGRRNPSKATESDDAFFSARLVHNCLSFLDAITALRMDKSSTSGAFSANANDALTNSFKGTSLGGVVSLLLALFVHRPDQTPPQSTTSAKSGSARRAAPKSASSAAGASSGDIGSISSAVVFNIAIVALKVLNNLARINVKTLQVPSQRVVHRWRRNPQSMHAQSHAPSLLGALPRARH